MDVHFNIDTTGFDTKVIIGVSIEGIGINFEVFRDKHNKFRISANINKAIGCK